MMHYYYYIDIIIIIIILIFYKLNSFFVMTISYMSEDKFVVLLCINDSKGITFRNKIPTIIL